MKPINRTGPIGLGAGLPEFGTNLLGGVSVDVGHDHPHPGIRKGQGHPAPDAAPTARYDSNFPVYVFQFDLVCVGSRK